MEIAFSDNSWSVHASPLCSSPPILPFLTRHPPVWLLTIGLAPGCAMGTLLCQSGGTGRAKPGQMTRHVARLASSSDYW